MDPRVSQIIQTMEDYVDYLNPRVSSQNTKSVRLNEEDVSPENLERSVNLSETRLRALFKAETGMTPAQYLENRRMEQAREMTKTTHLRIIEILTIIRVSDPSHFLRKFKKKYNVTLTEYRKQFWTDNQ